MTEDEPQSNDGGRDASADQRSLSDVSGDTDDGEPLDRELSLRESNRRDSRKPGKSVGKKTGKSVGKESGTFSTSPSDRSDDPMGGSRDGTGAHPHPRDSAGAHGRDNAGAHGRDKDTSDDTSSTASDGALGIDVGIDDVIQDDGANQGLFDDLLSGEPIFENKEVLRPSYTPDELPHRSEQINNMATILVSALRGETPSNILIYGKTGTGKTASAKFVSQELEGTSRKYEVPCVVEYINCEVTDTQYRVLAQLANKFIDKNHDQIDRWLEELRALRTDVADGRRDLAGTQFESIGALNDRIDALQDEREGMEKVPMTGWPTDRVYSVFFEAVDYLERVVVIMLDEIDKLVEKSGDDTLYNLSRMNSELVNSRVSIMGISNDLKFTDFLDPRVKSSLGEEEIVFPPYDATQLQDILQHRANVAFEKGALTDGVIPLCAAFAAQEHGDARRALDLLRTAGELAERSKADYVDEEHVRQAQEKIELDRVVEVVRTLPTQSKLVLFAIILLEGHGVQNINTGEVYNIYKRLCQELDTDVLTQRRVTDLISELDMLGIVNAVVVSKGRYGRTKEISLSVPVQETEAVLMSDSRLGDIDDVQPFVQARFDN